MLADIVQPVLLRHLEIKDLPSLKMLQRTLDCSPAYLLAVGRYIRTLSIKSPVVPPHLCCELVSQLAAAQEVAHGTTLEGGGHRLHLHRLSLCFPASEVACPFVSRLLQMVSPQRLEWLSSPCWSVSLRDLSGCLAGMSRLTSLTLGGFLVDKSLVRELNALLHIDELHLLGWHDSNTFSVHPAVLQELLDPSVMHQARLARVSLAGCSTEHAALLTQSVKDAPSPCSEESLCLPPISHPWTARLDGKDTMIISRFT